MIYFLHYELFQGNDISILANDDRISIKDYEIVMGEKHLLLDVRSEAEFQMCCLPFSINIPFADITSNKHVEKINKVFASKEVENKDTGKHRIKHLFLLAAG